MKRNIILIILIIILSTIIFYFLLNHIYSPHKNKLELEKSYTKISTELKNSPFKIDKIILYSSASGENKNVNFQNKNWLLDIFQYTDIAIYLNSLQPIKSLSISSPTFSKTSQNLYYLDSTKFGTDKIEKNFEIKENLEFTVLNFNNHDNSIGYNTPIFFSDSSNPITLKFTNMLYKDYTIKNSEKLIFNGNIISKTPAKLENISSNISFNINITNYNNEDFTTTLQIDIPIKTENSTILDGHIYVEKNNLNIPFFKIKK